LFSSCWVLKSNPGQSHIAWPWEKWRDREKTQHLRKVNTEEVNWR
jgi:hypothetical protein